MKKYLLVVFVLLGPILFSLSQKIIEDDASKNMIHIGINQIVEHPALDNSAQGIKDALSRAGYTDGKNVKIVWRSANANAATALQISKDFVTKNYNAIVALGTVSAQSAKKATEGTDIPVIFVSITDPIEAKLLHNLHMPEGNVTGVSNHIASDYQIEEFMKYIPTMKILGTVYNPGEDNSVILVNEMDRATGARQISFVKAIATKSTEVPAAVDKLVSQKVDAILINSDNTALSAMTSIVKIAGKHGIPILSTDTDNVEQGAKMAVGADQYDIGLQAGEMLVKILKDGKSVSDIPVEFPKNPLKVTAEDNK